MHLLRLIPALVLIFLFAMPCASSARPVYLKDGGILESQWVKRDGNSVIAKVNRDIVVTFSKDEIDLGKTFAKKMKRSVRAATSNTPEKSGTEVAPPSKPALEGKNRQAQPKAPAKPVSAAADKKMPDLKAVPKPLPPEKPAKPPPMPKPPTDEPNLIPAAPPGVPNLSAMSSTVLSVATVIILLLSIIVIAGYWKIFEKAGIAGWKCLIPIYNLYLIFVIAGKPWWWLLLMLVPIVSVAIYLLTLLSLAAKFGKGPLFGVGLFFLPFIFFPLLGFDTSEYSG